MAYDGLVPPPAVVVVKEPGACAKRHLLALARRRPVAVYRPGRGRAHEAREGEEECEGGGVHFAALESRLTSASPLLPAF